MNALFLNLASALIQGGLATAAPAAALNERTFWMPKQSSTVAPSIDAMFMAITWVSYFFFFLIVGIMVVFIVRYRQRGREIHAHGPTHHTPLEITWTIVPLIIVVIIFFGGFKGYLALATPPANSYQIDVVAQQWYWNFKYPNGAKSTDLYVPAGRPVKLVMRSEDVLHSLFIPDFRVKKDVLPSRYTVLWFQCDQPTGKDPKDDKIDLFHILHCTEYCGKDHSRMNAKVIVLPEAEFKLWEDKQARWLDEILDKDLYWDAGPKLFARCQSCHTLDGTPSTGPSWGPHDGLPAIWDRTSKGLTKFAGGGTLADIMGEGKEFTTPEDYLTNSILIPNKHLVESFGPAMPTFQGQLDSRGIRALIDFMKHIDEFDSKAKWLKTPPPEADAAAAPAATP
ncbi:MAG: cytochrome c oxidase subunit II transmembrane domain-containing protein [Phycisphaerae bacterium]|nr:cytochrome c oxidase subunit II transmembrane domain-containing protein [Phycisphaerae bacterium]